MVGETGGIKEKHTWQAGWRLELPRRRRGNFIKKMEIRGMGILAESRLTSGGEYVNLKTYNYKVI